jgi:hypothetical protein
MYTCWYPSAGKPGAPPASNGRNAQRALVFGRKLADQDAMPVTGGCVLPGAAIVVRNTRLKSHDIIREPYSLESGRKHLASSAFLFSIMTKLNMHRERVNLPTTGDL